MQKSINIFCCCAPKDQPFLVELRIHLFALQRQDLITTWSDINVRAGLNRDEQVLAHLDQAHVILLLISSAFLANDSCYKEMQRAMERYERGEACVVPVILGPVNLQGLPIEELSVLPRNEVPISRWKDLDDALFDVAQGVRQVVEEIPIDVVTAASIRERETQRESASRARHNLPRLSHDFLGRERDISRVLRALASRSFIICIEGMGGVGKTTLAIQTAIYSLSDPNRLFESVVWITAVDRLDQELWFSEVLDTIARELGSPALVKLPLEQRALEIEELLSNQNVLVVLDNYETMMNDKDLNSWITRKIQLLPRSKVLITSRTSSMRNAEPIQLRGMPKPEALTLIRRHCRRWELKSLEIAPDEKLLPLVEVTEGNPKAIELALGHIKRGGLAFEEVINHLYHANDSVDHIFADLYQRSWEKMQTNAKQVLMVLPFFANSVKREALGCAADLSGFYLQSAVEELVDFMFLEVNQERLDPSPQYHTHPLIRAFSKKQLQAAPVYEQESRLRWCKYYYEIIKCVLVKGRSGDLYWDSLVRSGEASLIDEEWSNIRLVLEWADLGGLDTVLIDLMLLLAHYMNRHFYYPERLLYAQKAAKAAERTQRQKEAALFHIDTLGWTFIESNRLVEAEQNIRRGLQIAQSIEPLTQEVTELIALAYVFLARVALQQGDLTAAAEFIHLGDVPHCRPVIQFRAAMITGDIVYRQGDVVAAIQCYKQAQQIGGQYGNEGEDEDLAYRMAIAYLASGDLENAKSSFNNLPNLEKYATVTTGAIYTSLKEAHFARARGDIEQARHLTQAALNYLSPVIESHWMLDEIRTFLKNLEPT